MSKKHKRSKEIIRSSSTTLKFSNAGRLKDLSIFIDEYQKVVSLTIDYLWELEDIPPLLPKEFTDVISDQTWLSARAVQAACKQASGIVRGTRTKQIKRLKKIEEFQKNGMSKKARKLQRIYNQVKVSKPNISNVCPELDSRFIKSDMDNETSFDGWITLTSLGNNLKIVLPFKKTFHFNEMLKAGTLKNGARLSKDSITFNFLMSNPIKKEQGKTVGVDIGIKDVCVLSDKTEFKKDVHGHSLESIQAKLSKKVKGSKAFGKSQKHRANYIKWFLNQIDFNEIKTLRMEDIKHLRKNKRTNRYMTHWTYTEIKNKLEDLALLSGVQIVKISPTYTSQRCHKCGWTRKRNRKGKQFFCTACGNACDADFNASLNISLDLPEISKGERLLQKNRKGFYWNVAGQEPIVPVVLKA